MNNETQKKFAEILANAQAKAAQKTVLKSAPKKEEKPEIVMPELSDLTVDDILEQQETIARGEPRGEPLLNAVIEKLHEIEAKKPLQLIDYSDKAFAIIGETKPIKDQLKQLGGKYNAFLKCGAGWIFSKKKIEDVKKALGL